jgi:hypothetical protein
MDVRPCAERNEFAHGKETGIDGARTKTVLYHVLRALSRDFLSFFLYLSRLFAGFGQKSVFVGDLPAKCEKNRQAILTKTVKRCIMKIVYFKKERGVL